MFLLCFHLRNDLHPSQSELRRTAVSKMDGHDRIQSENCHIDTQATLNSLIITQTFKIEKMFDRVIKNLQVYSGCIIQYYMIKVLVYTFTFQAFKLQIQFVNTLSRNAHFILFLTEAQKDTRKRSCKESDGISTGSKAFTQHLS